MLVLREKEKRRDHLIKRTRAAEIHPYLLPPLSSIDLSPIPRASQTKEKSRSKVHECMWRVVWHAVRCLVPVQRVVCRCIPLYELTSLLASLIIVPITRLQSINCTTSFIRMHARSLVSKPRYLSQSPLCHLMFPVRWVE